MNRTQISAVFLIAMTILFAMNINLASFIGFIYQQNAIFVLRLLDLYSKTTNSPSKEDFQVFYSALKFSTPE